MAFPQRELGRTGVKVSAFGLGCMRMSTDPGPRNEEEIYATLNRALELGITFWDTARIYGDNEILLSKILKERRKDVFLCTKFGFDTDEKGNRIVNGKPDYVKKSCAESLQRLGVDHIDLFYQHRVDKNTPIEETVGAMAELVKEGKVRFIGLSECSAETLRRAHKVHPIAAVQVEYSLWETNIEESGLLQAARELGVSIVAYSPLGRGFLTGQIKSRKDFEAGDSRLYFPRFSEENFPKNLEIVHAVEELAKKKGVTPGQIALAWCLAQGPEVIPIPGTKRVKYLEENAAAINVELSKDEVEQLRKLAHIAVGERYPAQFMKDLDR
eukprot:TRINITY_DN4612_c0_g1_i2.p1 TRINITY_DN4612_c0_g1~~TRINITY_DN4612_c0_g1_i2.p1  ORF type:complete len:327 (-),score=76.21 TRINITY_DN4612_c0_g1_i2:41-1021(-)